MQFIKPGTNIDFMGKRKIGFVFSLILILAGIVSLIIHNGPNYGIDFAGGTLVQVKFPQKVDVSDIRKGLDEIGLKDVSVQGFGEQEANEYLIRTSSDTDALGDQLSDTVSKGLKEATSLEPDIRRVEMVGPQVGKDLKKNALLAIFYSLLFITIYISGRFEQKWTIAGITAGALMAAVYFLSVFNLSMPVLIAAALIVSLVLFWYLQLQYAIGAIVALIHDVTITVGVFSLLNLDFSLQIIAALLTIIGYSLNDTIIVFDRIRENIKGNSDHTMVADLFNRSINETLSRTILTSLTTLVVLLALFLLGGEIIHNFAFAMIIGVVVGTYSSIFIASPLVFMAHRKK
ncbi:protein translocase subunit SecF [Desulfobacter hydrogenophilus]|uniref:Protein-export membrane protein SecF n=1 Tax=Desulfobacter hydrogenophilus TaxID=2291 RepID=A0A328FID9_9BACT|nr:protein translocase subunit SecF [Desulfobacter hydrogenophilus]NDY70598.1 protein translocase subunit SecF [Desulfobacter hydrogenophilus]QBH13967.1 protein translocase subunit SecF [Desulfobacter hydrogenophilus]RAM03620.1 protein translocase subunit SecF [Desulfobacter hydrogenophilus]